MSETQFVMTQIGVVHSCYSEKFGIPRTSNLATAARAELELFHPWGVQEALRDLEGISHIWLFFKFHQNSRSDWSPTVRPPRLGGNRQISVFASRSPVRPNPLGLSVVRYYGHRLIKGGRAFLDIGGHDLVEGTPIYDIKPYVNESDRIEDATQGWIGAQEFATPIAVRLSEDCDDICRRQSASYPQLRELIIQVIALDPRPAYKRGDGEWGVSLCGFNVRWRVSGSCAEVFSITAER